MNADSEGTPQGKSIARTDLEKVIRRAAELANVEADADENLSEDEVVRIAMELGLSPAHARQALYEMPELQPAPSLFSSRFGSAIVTASRTVPGDAEITLRRLEEYLCTREYLQMVRRRHGRAFFTPADDTISSLARGLLRPSSRFQLARSRRVVLSARPLGEGSTHVQIGTDMTDQRTSAIRRGVAFGGMSGVFVGSIGAMLVATAGLPDAAAIAGGLLAFGGGMSAGITAGVMTMGARFRGRMASARTELDGLLDRAERGERLEPPPAPWRRRLQLRLLGPHERGS